MHADLLSRRLLAEGLGSALLAATVVGSGIMAQRLAGGNLAIALLANTGATVAVLYTLISLLGPISGAHFNPAVLTDTFAGIRPVDAPAFIAAQLIGAIAALGVGRALFPAAKPASVSSDGEPTIKSTDKHPEALNV